MLAQLHEQRHKKAASGLVGTHDQAVQYLIDALECPVDLGRTNADAKTIEGGVRAPVNEAAPALIDLHEIAVPPYTGVNAEIGLPIANKIGIAPDAYGHRRHRLG